MLIRYSNNEILDTNEAFVKIAVEMENGDIRSWIPRTFMHRLLL